ncbi:GDSL esterase/lipase At4g01130 isoform X1 [Nymphaea colorata]|nr:GDSL esterase/lipase At4g01130 isoform X1 [Nymphaea colorata]
MGCFRPRNLAVFRQLLLAAGLVLALHAKVHHIDAKCEFDAIFNFGDSNSDTGGFYAAFPAQSSPWGMTYFGMPTGRASDGRLVVDFLAQALGLPFLSPYLQALGSDFTHGANFATLASTVLLPNTSLFVTGISPFSLAIQRNQMKEFKARVTQLRFQGKDTKGLPPLNVFGKSLYTFNIGQNDFTSNLAAIGIEGVKQYLPDVVNEIAWTIKVLYDEGGRTFLVQNLAPIGCYPAFLVELPHGRSDLDEYGCMTSYNDAVSYYNSLLKGRLDQLRPQLPQASVIYVDTHTVELELFRNPTHHGLKYGTRACCGHGGDPYNFDPRVFCGNTKVINGSTVTASACSDPQNYVSWDGIHFSEAANKAIAYAILSGDYFSPSFPIGKLCDLQPIG